MASWKGLYINVDAPEHATTEEEEPRDHEPKGQPAGSKEKPDEDSLYEAVDPATRLEVKPREQVPPEWSPARKPMYSRKVVMLTGAALLAVSVFLNVLLLTMGTVHYSKMTDTLEQVQKENKRLKDADEMACYKLTYIQLTTDKIECEIPVETKALAAPSPFLLYNEDKNVCATIQEQNYLTAASCSPDVQDQYFQPLSGGLLHHVASQLCVAAPSRKNKMALVLTPCNPRSSLQHWECRNHDLLALKGTDLYFNYGNSVNKRVMLYDGNGPWSRWLIYGTHNNICNSCNPLGRDWTSFQESYYFFSHSPGSWDVANQSCISMGSHLVTINSAEEKEQKHISNEDDDYSNHGTHGFVVCEAVHMLAYEDLDYVATIMKTTSFWIGLTDQQLEGTWKWVDGTKLGPENRYWHSTEPNGGKNENCAMMSHGMWYDFPCKERRHWVCKRKL
ncbi:hypothetical protein JD844_009995 [Phrynosoma platyrhinos]|uniref:C-type lectin domain-containing protein n=1 Tax=Phrynosoma platyrhinos TaxID=52577 RepID=A0ABQ7TGV0_PHRPL|nr:hypothetical protein JD844_009995 [Phrynosoma platyrhinos]